MLPVGLPVDIHILFPFCIPPLNVPTEFPFFSLKLPDAKDIPLFTPITNSNWTLSYCNHRINIYKERKHD